LVKNSSNENRAKNRRVEIALIPQVKRKPASAKIKELKKRLEEKNYELPDSLKKTIGIKDATKTTK
jgi:hypothetical protein